MYGNPEVTSGGNALKFYSSIRIDIRRKEIVNKNTMIVKIKIVKNKIYIPFQTIELEITLGQGINRYVCLFNTALNYNIIEKKGSWYYYKKKQLNQGKTNCINMLKDKNLYFKDIMNGADMSEEEEDDDDDIKNEEKYINNDEIDNQNLSLGEEIEAKVKDFIHKKKNGIIVSDDDNEEYKEENDEFNPYTQ